MENPFKRIGKSAAIGATIVGGLGTMASAASDIDDNDSDENSTIDLNSSTIKGGLGIGAILGGGLTTAKIAGEEYLKQRALNKKQKEEQGK